MIQSQYQCPNVDEVYLSIAARILEDGEERSDRTGTGTFSMFGPQFQIDLRDGFPLLTTKQIYFPAVVNELFWFLRGETNIKTLKSPRLWEAWADVAGNLGPIYGQQWRAWPVIERCYWERVERPFDQIADLIHRIKTNPTDRRLIVSAWNVSDLPEMKLPPCHLMFQCYVSQGKFLDLKLFQRSADWAIGVPFNIASYALLMEVLAHECGLTARYFIHTFGDAHIYKNHVEGMHEQLTRVPLALPKLHIEDGFELGELIQLEEAVTLEGYNPHPRIKFDVSV